MKRLFATTAIAALVATGASAGDFSKTGTAVAEPQIATPSMPTVSPRFDWTGGYVGAGIGYGRMNISGFDNRSSAVGGLFAGYRWDMGNAVVGGELLVSPGNFGSSTLPGPSGDEVKAGASLMLSAGMPVTADARTLGYIAAGPSMIRTSGAGGSETSTGAGVQLGLDHMITDQIMLRGAVNYTAINNVGNDDLKTRTLGAGVGVAFKF